MVNKRGTTGLICREFDCWLRNPMSPGHMLYHARAAGEHYPSRGSRRARFEHVSAGMPNARENRHVLCSLHWDWDWARAPQGPKGQRASGHFFNGRESLRDSWERLCPRALAIRSPPNATYSVTHCCQSSIRLHHSCKDKVLHRRFRADADLGGPRPGRLLVHRPGHRQIRVGRLQVDR